MKFNELIRLLEEDKFKIVKQNGSIRYYGKSGWNKLIRLDYHGSKEVPTVSLSQHSKGCRNQTDIRRII